MEGKNIDPNYKKWLEIKQKENKKMIEKQINELLKLNKK